MSGISRRAWLLATIAGLLLAGVLVSPGGVAQALAYLLPALLLLGVLAARWYPGERTLLRIASRRRRRGRSVAPGVARLGRLACALVPRGGLLLGCSLAVRPPPRWLFVLD